MAKQNYLAGGVSSSPRGVHEKWDCRLSMRVQGLHARWPDAVTTFSSKPRTDGRATGYSNWPWSARGHRRHRPPVPSLNIALLLGLVGCTHLYDDRNNMPSTGSLAVTDPLLPPPPPAENDPLDAMAPPSQKPADGDALPAGGAPPPPATGGPPPNTAPPNTAPPKTAPPKTAPPVEKPVTKNPQNDGLPPRDPQKGDPSAGIPPAEDPPAEDPPQQGTPQPVPQTVPQPDPQPDPQDVVLIKPPLTPVASHPLPPKLDPVPTVSPNQYDIVGAGNWSGHGKGVAIIGNPTGDGASIVSPHGSVIYLGTGGSVRNPQIVELGGGVDHVIYRIGPGQRLDSWQARDGVQQIQKFDIGVDKLWFAKAREAPGWTQSLEGLKTRVAEGMITYETADITDDNNDDHNAIVAVKISTYALTFTNVIAFQLDLRFDQPDDQTRAFEILSGKRTAHDKGRIKTFAEIMGSSLGFIDDWSDLGLEELLPDTSQLPTIL